MVLRADSTLQWFGKRRRQTGCRAEGAVCLHNHPELVAVAQFTLHLPDYPRLGRLDQATRVLAIGTLLLRRRPTPERLYKVIWLKAKTRRDCR